MFFGIEGSNCSSDSVLVQNAAFFERGWFCGQETNPNTLSTGASYLVHIFYNLRCICYFMFAVSLFLLRIGALTIASRPQSEALENVVLRKPKKKPTGA